MEEKTPSFKLNTTYENSNLTVIIENMDTIFGFLIKLNLFICKNSFVEPFKKTTNKITKQLLLPNTKNCIKIDNVLLENNDILVITLKIEGQNFAYSFDYSEEKKELINLKELKIFSRTTSIQTIHEEEEKRNKALESIIETTKDMEKMLSKFENIS